MPDHTEGLATEQSPPTTEQVNHPLYAAAFDAAITGINSDPDIDIPPGTTPEKPPEKKQNSVAPPEAVPTEEPEFPAELMGEEKVKEVVAVADDLDEIKLHANTKQETRDRFEDLKGKAREARAQAEKFRVELETVKSAKPVSVDEGEALKAANARIKEMEEVVEKSAFTLSPKYQAIVANKEQAIADAKGYLEGLEIDPSVIEAAAHMKGAKRVAALRDAGIDAETIAVIGVSLAQADTAERERISSLESAKGWREQQAASDAAKAAHIKDMERAEEDRIYATAGEQVAKVFEPFQKIAGADKWNAQVDRLTAEAKEFFNGSMTPDQIAEIAHYGVGAKVIHKMFHAQRAEVKALRETVAKLSASQPGNGVSNGRSNAETAAPKNADDLFRQRMATFDSVMQNQG